MTCRLDYYTADELQKIILRSAGLISAEIDAGGALEIAGRSRGTPQTILSPRRHFGQRFLRDRKRSGRELSRRRRAPAFGVMRDVVGARHVGFPRRLEPRDPAPRERVARRVPIEQVLEKERRTQLPG